MGFASVVRLILNNSKVQSNVTTTLLERVPLHYACQNGHLVVVSLLMSRMPQHLRSRDKKGCLPLHLAAENGHTDMVSMLLGQGADVNSADSDGWTPLHYAARNGYLKVVKLLIETGASTVMKTVDGKIALVLSANGGHVDVLTYLLRKEHDSNELLEDNTFLLDIMLCGRTNSNQTVDDFVMHSKAPLYTAARLAISYREQLDRERERTKDLNDAARHCENMATELLGISSAVAPASVILRAHDSKGKQFLDMLLEHSLKQMIEHASVQRYLSDIWSGSLSHWSVWRFLLLAIGFTFFPPLTVYFCLPFKHNKYQHIPVIKFLGLIVSHLYLIVLLSMIAAVPLDPVLHRKTYFPNWFEWLCLAWVSGMLVAELSKFVLPSGLGLLRIVIIFFFAVAVLFQMSAIILRSFTPFFLN